MMRERMGSGGPPGLQILVPGAFGVRGGFDSHTFPPFFARVAAVLVTAALAFAPTSARAQVREPLAVVRPDTVGTVRPDTVAAAVPERRGTKGPDRPTPWHEQPRFVMARSALIPGWGQFHNRAWFKAAAVAGAEALYIVRIVDDTRALEGLLTDLDAARAAGDAAREEALVNEYNARLDQRLGRQWVLGAIVAYALIDAYVDANFRGFDAEFRFDPALPDGPPPGHSSRGAGLGMRLSLRRHF